MKRAIWLLVVGLLLVMPCSQALAEHGGGHDRGHYKYHDAGYHRDGWIWFGIGVTTLAIGAIITALSPRYKAVVLNGETYYYDDGVYYLKNSRGYVVVPEPVVVQQPAYTPTPSNSTGETFVVNIPNSNGAYTPVTLVKSGNGYIGPQGEFYPGRPSVDQLRVLYGE